MQLSYNFTWTIKPPDHPKFFAYHTNYTLPCSCLWTVDVRRVVASIPPDISEGEEGTTGNTSAVRRLIFLQT